ncbi:MAG: ethylbenzene dehydrogenase-related protein, partial [SAR202 cluster bacterium]|nr:ethylbenzene dehydrogenase-related protein [SAR202 cluster bacterium]
MSIQEYTTNRRALLAGALIGAVGWVGRPLFKRLEARRRLAGIVAVSVDKAPTDPDDILWFRPPVAAVDLVPQTQVLPRLREAATQKIEVRALYDVDRLSVLVEWRDAHKDDDLGTVMQYRDGVAIQFPNDPLGAIPNFTMGDEGNGVTIYHWKSDWQFARLVDVDEAYPNMYGDWYPYSGVEAGEMPEATDYLERGRSEYLTAAAAGNALADPLVQEKMGPVQKMKAEGYGTIEPADEQDAMGVGVWSEGVWRIVISVPRGQANFSFEEGAIFPMAFAVWDGSRNERNGQKAFAEWQDLELASQIPVATPSAPVSRTDEGGGNILWPTLGGV